jgi:hypothetical protein
MKNKKSPKDKDKKDDEDELTRPKLTPEKP